MKKHFIEMLENAAELSDMQEFSEAIKIYDRILTEDPKNIGAMVDKATTLQRTGNNKESLKLFDAALEISPKNVDAMIGKGSVLHLSLIHI